MQETPVARVLSASDMIGFGVRNPQDEDLGKIDDLMIDTAEGRVAYAVLSFGGLLGLGAKQFAIPWDALSIHPNEEYFIMDVPKEKLENAPGYDKDNPPEQASREWLGGVYSHYGYEPYWRREIRR